MSHLTTTHHRRRHHLAPSDHRTTMDPTPTTTSSASKPHPDPPTAATIQHISNHFSNLYTNHKQVSSFNKHPSSVDTYLQPTKSMAAVPCPTAVSHSSAASLTKSHSQRRPNLAETGKQGNRVQRLVKVKKLVKEFDEGQEIKREILNEGKKLSEKDREMKESFEGMEVIKKPNNLSLMGTNQESDLKELQLLEHEMKRQSFSSSSVGGGGRRKSFCSSQTELANFLSCNGVKIVSVDMPPFMQIHAVDCARKTHDSLEKFTAKTLALTLKKEFDGVYGPAWHCIVGTSFGSFVTHSVGGFLYFSMDQKHYVLLFKTTVQKAS